jgi:hypothetical protein
MAAPAPGAPIPTRRLGGIAPHVPAAPEEPSHVPPCLPESSAASHVVVLATASPEADISSAPLLEALQGSFSSFPLFFDQSLRICQNLADNSTVGLSLRVDGSVSQCCGYEIIFFGLDYWLWHNCFFFSVPDSDPNSNSA